MLWWTRHSCLVYTHLSQKFLSLSSPDFSIAPLNLFFFWFFAGCKLASFSKKISRISFYFLPMTREILILFKTLNLHTRTSYWSLSSFSLYCFHIVAFFVLVFTASLVFSTTYLVCHFLTNSFRQAWSCCFLLYCLFMSLCYYLKILTSRSDVEGDCERNIVVKKKKWKKNFFSYIDYMLMLHTIWLYLIFASIHSFLVQIMLHSNQPKN